LRSQWDRPPGLSKPFRQPVNRLNGSNRADAVEKLRCVKIGFLELTPLRAGEFRELTPREVERFRKMLKMEDGDDAKRS
jgi:hypothetical protein